MKVSLEVERSLPETEVLVRCPAVDEQVQSLMSCLRMHDRKLVGFCGGEAVVVPLGSILYLESVDGLTFAYTSEQVIEARLRLSEVEEQLRGAGFARASKGCLVNLYRIAGFRPCAGGRLLARIENGEELIISRKYAKAVRAMLCAE